MKRIFLFAVSAALAACAQAPEMPAAGFTAANDTVVVDNPGKVTVAGVTPAAALGAIDTRKVIAKPAVPNGGETASATPDADTEANGSISVEGAQPAAVLGAIDPKKLIDKKPDAPK